MTLKEQLSLAIASATHEGKDTLLEYRFDISSGAVVVMAELAITAEGVLEFNDMCVYPAIENSIPKGTIHPALRRQVGQLLQYTTELGYPVVKMQGERVAGSSAANPGRKVSILRKGTP